MISKPTLKTPTVLIVDDNPTNVKIIAITLQLLKYKIVIATNGLGAIEMVKRTRPDLILMDVMMPEMDGYETCKIIKEDKVNENIPVIFLTALNDKENIVKGFDVGGVDYISKPFNKEEFISRVQTHLELKLTRDELQETSNYLTDLNSIKDKMFSVIGHDLRSPLSSVKMSLEFLSQTINKNEDEEFKEIMDTLVKTTDEVFSLLENLLGWAKSQSGNLNLIPEKVNLKDLVDSIYFLNKGNLSFKKIQFETDFDDDISLNVDLNTIKIVFRNLLSNAIKFTPNNGTISISAKIENDFAQVVVQDSGVGIAKENIEKLFNSTQQYSTYGTNRESGSGLGLILCHDFVIRNGGEISVKSIVGDGTEFILKLPIAK